MLDGSWLVIQGSSLVAHGQGGLAWPRGLGERRNRARTKRAVAALESLVISAFGHAALRRAAEAVAAGDACVDLGAKMLRDEHLPTLRTLVESGAFNSATTLSFNAISSLTTLPDLTGLDALRTLTMVNCTGLRRLPDFSGLPSLQTVKLENCRQLEALPALRPGLEWDDNFLPEHLRSAMPMAAPDAVAE